MAFKMRSQSAVSSGGFKMMGSSPLTMPGHGAPKGHVHDGDSWTHQEVVKDDDGTARIINSSGTVGQKGTADRVIETPSESGETTTVSTDPIPTAKGGVQTEDTDAYIKSLKERFPSASRQDMIDQGYISGSWSGDWTDPEIETTTDPDVEPTTKVIPGDAGTPDTMKREVLEAGPGGGAITDDLSFETRQPKSKLSKWWTRVKEGRELKKSLRNQENKGATSGGGSKRCEKGKACEAYD